MKELEQHLHTARRLAAQDLSKSREASLVLTKIDEAIMWTLAARNNPSMSTPAPTAPPAPDREPSA